MWGKTESIVYRERQLANRWLWKANKNRDQERKEWCSSVASSLNGSRLIVCMCGCLCDDDCRFP